MSVHRDAVLGKNHSFGRGGRGEKARKLLLGAPRLQYSRLANCAYRSDVGVVLCPKSSHASVITKKSNSILGYSSINQNDCNFNYTNNHNIAH